MKTSLYTTLNSLLDSQEKYKDENGSILRNKVIEDAQKMDADFLSLLMNSADIKKAFFAEAGGMLVFDKAKFSRFIDNKEFLPDSFTSYSQNIGLTCGGTFLKSTKDVVLDFPYKDCILEGGQTKDDQKRSEVFYNEVLAPDQVTNLLSPKAFCNAVKYDKNGKKEITEISENDNHIILIIAQ